MIVIAWSGTPAEAPDLRHIQGEIMRACLSRTDLTLYAPGFPVDARDPLWRLGTRLVTDVAPPRVDVHLFPLAGDRREGAQALIDRVGAAMGQGHAIIGTDRWPVGALVYDGRSGVLVRDGRPHDWNRAILRLAGDPVERVRLGRAARNTARAIETVEAQ